MEPIVDAMILSSQSMAKIQRQGESLNHGENNLHKITRVNQVFKFLFSSSLYMPKKTGGGGKGKKKTWRGTKGDLMSIH